MPKDERFVYIDDAFSSTVHHVLDTGAADHSRPALIASGNGYELAAIVDVLNAHPDDYDRALRAQDEGEPF